MGSAAAERSRMTEEEYLAFERASDVRHEFVNGEIVAMAGGSPRHGLIATNVTIALGTRLRGGPCRAVNSDVRVHIPDTGLYTYPDVTVVCGQPETHPADRDALTNPRVIFEVLSRSTEAYDRGAKFDHYRRCATLAEYVLVDQRERRILHHRRVEGGWLLSEVGPDGTLALPALGCEIPLAEIYEGAEAWPPDED